ncbi:MAG: hypothetical protein NTV87_16225 [Ignavibacteriae bacterium]|nr:hypothetical protein [Ignavibacteriota bacterium]
MIITVQLNHPGKEKKFEIGKGYFHSDGIDYREWNNDKTHYRKFIEHTGLYVSGLKKQKPVKGRLLFWGEWEGYSIFQPLNRLNPNGVHKPLHCIKNRGHQNTDPYIYGDNFKYAICKQRGHLTQLDEDSLILFGSSYEKHFCLDTVFVIKSYESCNDVAKNRANNYSKIYKQATLNQLNNAYAIPVENPSLRLYKSLSYYDDSNYFSYVPCKVYNSGNAKGFERVKIPYGDLGGFELSDNPTGVKYPGTDLVITKNIWKIITNYVLNQGFSLGIQFDEPPVKDL